MNKDKIEFRKDPVSGDWVLVSPKAKKKPVFFRQDRYVPLPKSACPFEGRRLLEQGEPLLWLPKPGKNDIKDWWVQIFSNRYPVVKASRICPPLETDGMYDYKEGVGFQEVVLTRDHARPIGLMEKKEIELIIEAYMTRFQALQNESCVEYVFIFHNSGASAGATVPHPHSQILAMPIIPPDVAKSLAYSRSYHTKHSRCVHCDIIKLELKKKIRVIFENESFVAVAPYASHVSFEIRIFPKKHEAHFEAIDSKQLSDFAEAMAFVFSRLHSKIKNPDYNFFIHTAPPKGKDFRHYHWHMEILPRISVWGGVELGVGIDIIKISPEEATKILRK